MTETQVVPEKMLLIDSLSTSCSLVRRKVSMMISCTFDVSLMRSYFFRLDESSSGRRFFMKFETL